MKDSVNIINEKNMSSESEALAYVGEVNVEEDSLKNKYLTFKVHDDEYGIEVRYVIEIIGIQKITQLPDMPNFIKGVINLRGRVIPLLDIRLRFKLDEIEYGNRTCIIVVAVGDAYFGLIVDTVSEVVDIMPGQIDPPPKSNLSTSNKYIQGMGKFGDQVKIILNVNKILSDDELNSLASKN